ALVNQGALTARGPSALGGPLTTAATSQLRVQGDGSFGTGTLTVTAGFTNLGTIELTSVGAGFDANLNVTAGTLVNAPGAFLKALPGAGGNRTITAKVDNQGTIQVDSVFSAITSPGDLVN